MGGTGTGVNINSLVVNEVLAGQISPQPIYFGTISGELHAINSFTLNGLHYVFLQGTYVANTREFEGHFFAVKTDRTNIDDGTIDIDNGGNTRAMRGAMTGQNGVSIRENADEKRTKYTLPGYHTLISADHTIVDGQHVLYIGGLSAGITITLPDYATTPDNVYKIVNADSVYSITIARASSGDYINGTAADFALAADTSIEIHNTQISSIGWATTYKSNRK